MEYRTTTESIVESTLIPQPKGDGWRVHSWVIKPNGDGDQMCILCEREAPPTAGVAKEEREA